MQTPGTKNAEKQPSTWMDAVMGIAMIPVLAVGACLAIPYTIAARWLRLHREHKLRLLMKSRGRLITWAEFVRAMHERGGTCVEEKFSPKGPVRFWWTPDDVHRESPHEIIDWFTMRKGRQYEPFVHWCRARYTSADGGSAMLVDTPLVPRREIYALWSECRSDASKALWIEVAPPEILPHKPGE
ncbi:MAG: hypothetical protein ABSD59_06930 [Terracidiphilus sp.]|jgi:hypothetical protein